MTHPLPTRTAGRIKWFSQLTAALDEAQCLLTQLINHGGDPGEADRTRAQILALSCEIEVLRNGGFLARRTIAPEAAPPSWQRSAV